MTERNNALAPSHSQRHPPDVEEALSSMLWTPYERTTESSAEEDDELPNREKRALCRSQSNWDQRTTTGNHRQQQQQQHAHHNRYSSALEYLGSDSFVPFSTYILSNCATTADDFNVIERQHSMENHQRKDFVHYHNRYSNPYFGPLPNLNKWWSSSTSNTKELPSYESLYAFKSGFPNTLSTTSSTTALKIISPHGSDNRKTNFNDIHCNGMLLSPVMPPYDFRAEEVSILY